MPGYNQLYERLTSLYKALPFLRVPCGIVKTEQHRTEYHWIPHGNEITYQVTKSNSSKTINSSAPWVSWCLSGSMNKEVQKLLALKCNDKLQILTLACHVSFVASTSGSFPVVVTIIELILHVYMIHACIYKPIITYMASYLASCCSNPV